MPKPADRDNLIFRQDYFDDPAGWQAITALLGDIFGVDISPLDRFGGHDRSNLASAFFDAEGICIANLSAFSMPLMIDGRIVRAGAWQSGAVRPAYRGQGLFRDLIHIRLSAARRQASRCWCSIPTSPAFMRPMASWPSHSFPSLDRRQQL